MRTWMKVGLAATVSFVTVAGVAGIVALARDGDQIAEVATRPTPSATPGATSVAVPAITASPSPSEPAPALSPPVDGAIPAPALPASHIPWLEVGPGWFAVLYDPDPEDNEGWNPEGLYPFENLTGAVMLVSPSGVLYYATSLDGQGEGHVDALTLSGLAVWKWAPGEAPTTDGVEESVIDLATGTRTVIGPYEAWALPFWEVLADGRSLVRARLPNSFAILDSDLAFVRAFGHYSAQNRCSRASPDDVNIVCLHGDADGRSEVWLTDIGSGTSVQIDTFKLRWFDYTLPGWWDDRTLIVERQGAEGIVQLAYDVPTRKIRDLGARTADGSAARFLPIDAGRYRVLSANGPAEIYDFDGTLRATVPCSDVAVSAGFALSHCRDERGVALAITNLETGEATMVARYSEPWGYFVWGQRYLALPFPG